MTYKLIVMSFDGDYKTESPEFENVDDAWSYAGDLGSKWYFYPFCFVIDQAEEIAAAGPMLEHLEGWTLSDVAAHFAEKSALPEAQGAGVEVFAMMV